MIKKWSENRAAILSGKTCPLNLWSKYKWVNSTLCLKMILYMGSLLMLDVKLFSTLALHDMQKQWGLQIYVCVDDCWKWWFQFHLANIWYYINLNPGDQTLFVAQVLLYPTKHGFWLCSQGLLISRAHCSLYSNNSAMNTLILFLLDSLELELNMILLLC